MQSVAEEVLAGDKPDTAWVTDITYIRTWEGWLYLAAVVDLHSRMIVGWSMQPTFARDIVLDALLMPVWRPKPRQTVIVHSDQGSQYGSDDWRRFCKAHRLDPSMSRRGNCWDNAVAESFFSSLKKESIRKQVYRTRGLAKADVFEYIDMFYNRTRRHTHLGGVSPAAVEASQTRASKRPSGRGKSMDLVWVPTSRVKVRRATARSEWTSGRVWHRTLGASAGHGGAVARS